MAEPRSEPNSSSARSTRRPTRRRRGLPAGGSARARDGRAAICRCRTRRSRGWGASWAAARAARSRSSFIAVLAPMRSVPVSVRRRRRTFSRVRAVRLEGPPHGQHELGEGDRFLEKIVGPEPGRLDRGLDGAVTRHHDDRRVDTAPAGPFPEQGDPVRTGHPDVQQNHVRPARPGAARGRPPRRPAATTS